MKVISMTGRGFLAARAVCLPRRELAGRCWFASWRRPTIASAVGQFTGLPTTAKASTTYAVILSAPGLDLEPARIACEAGGKNPALEASFSFASAKPGAGWIEAEAQCPDGRRVFAMTNFTVE
jgi:hypothetical protein